MTTPMLAGCSLQEVQNSVVEWADETHPDRTPESTLLKLFEELGEIVSDPKDAFEYADAFIVLLDVAYQNGITGMVLEQVIQTKMDINRERQWSINSMGVMSHE